MGSKDLAWGTNLASVPFPSQAISGQRPNKGQRRREDANEYLKKKITYFIKCTITSTNNNVTLKMGPFALWKFEHGK